MKLSLHLILIHGCVLERFIQDNFLPWEFRGCKGSIANHSACLKVPYNRFFELESLHFHSATEGNTLSVCGAFAHQNELEMCISQSASLSEHFLFAKRNHKILFGLPPAAAGCQRFQLAAPDGHICSGNMT